MQAQSPDEPLRVVHVITGLTVGGAETMLWRLLTALGPSIDNAVICLSSGGPLEAEIRALGVPVNVLGLPPGPRALLGLPALIRALRAHRPQVVHTWLYHADLLGGLAARFSGVPVIWGLHNSTLDLQRLGYATAWLIRLLAKLSSTLPAQIVSCSEVGRREHERGGYDAKRLVVIPNGFDTEQFRPDAELRSEARKSWGISGDKIAVGLFARFNPFKDHDTFLKAAGIAFESEPRLRFVLYGRDVSPQNSVLVGWARAAGVYEACELLGPEPSVARRLPGLDLLVSSSVSEAFPLILGEAMACGVPCVTTDVGDSAAIVGDSARVVPPSDPVALARAIVRAVRLSPDDRRAQAEAGQQSIRARFALPRIADRFRALYLRTARGSG